MEDQIDRLVDKIWEEYQNVPASRRLMIAVSGIPGSGKTTLASRVSQRINAINNQQAPGCTSIQISAFVPLDGFHLSRARLSALPDPANAHARRGAAFTFDDKSFLALVQKLREPILPESRTIYAPSFDHALKDPVAEDIAIPPTTRVLFFEGNYLSLNKGLWKEAAILMDELWFVHVDFETARRRLVQRHLKAGIAKDVEAAYKRVAENDLVNGQEIVDNRLDVQEMISSREDQGWKGSQ
ncbi:hypothetical protein MMC12_001736 [Toensbergia leucococca]|nr:hypothetical protein [Toensbergia leucococca]